MMISRKAALAEMEQHAAEFTTVTELDFYRELYQAQLSLMLSGLPYSRMVMDSALENIMRIAIEEETHQRFGEPPFVTEAERQAAEVYADNVVWLGLTGVDQTSGEVVRRDDEGSDTRPSALWLEHGLW